VPRLPAQAYRNLTLKQRKFAELLAQGYNRGEAYREVYASQAKLSTIRDNASRAMAHIPTAVEVARREEALLPITNAAAEIEWCLRNLKGLTADAKDERVRLVATIKLHEISSTRLERDTQSTKSHSDRAAVMSDLSALYRKALEQPIVEAVTISRPRPITLRVRKIAARNNLQNRSNR
jgi:hypothetical protein